LIILVSMWVVYVPESEMHRNELEGSPSKKSVSSVHIGPALPPLWSVQ
jgi:hypothetical protein